MPLTSMGKNWGHMQTLKNDPSGFSDTLGHANMHKVSRGQVQVLGQFQELWQRRGGGLVGGAPLENIAVRANTERCLCFSGFFFLS